MLPEDKDFYRMLLFEVSFFAFPYRQPIVSALTFATFSGYPETVHSGLLSKKIYST